MGGKLGPLVGRPELQASSVVAEGAGIGADTVSASKFYFSNLVRSVLSTSAADPQADQRLETITVESGFIDWEAGSEINILLSLSQLTNRHHIKTGVWAGAIGQL